MLVDSASKDTIPPTGVNQVWFIHGGLFYNNSRISRHDIVLNDRLNREAYNFWLVRALYPEVAKTIDAKLTEEPKGFIDKAEKAMVKQQAIIAAEAVAAQAEKDQKEAKQKLEKVKANK